jgi:hypothetical protein
MTTETKAIPPRGKEGNGMNFDELWVEPSSGARSWYSYLGDDEQAWLGQVADLIVLRGSEPFWRPVADRFKQEFPKAKDANSDTIKNTIRRLVADR